MLGKLWTAFGARLIGVAMVPLGAWVYKVTKGMVTVDPVSATELVMSGIGTYSASHRYASSKINPVDAASKPLADVHDSENAVLKAQRDRVDHRSGF